MANFTSTGFNKQWHWDLMGKIHLFPYRKTGFAITTLAWDFAYHLAARIDLSKYTSFVRFLFNGSVSSLTETVLHYF